MNFQKKYDKLIRKIVAAMQRFQYVDTHHRQVLLQNTYDRLHSMSQMEYVLMCEVDRVGYAEFVEKLGEGWLTTEPTPVTSFKRNDYAMYETYCFWGRLLNWVRDFEARVIRHGLNCYRSVGEDHPEFFGEQDRVTIDIETEGGLVAHITADEHAENVESAQSLAAAMRESGMFKEVRLNDEDVTSTSPGNATAVLGVVPHAPVGIDLKSFLSGDLSVPYAPKPLDAADHFSRFCATMREKRVRPQNRLMVMSMTNRG